MIDIRNYPQLIIKELRGQVDFMKCDLCKATGYINYEDEGNDIISGESKNLNRINEECSNCDGLGFVVKEF